MLLQQGDEVGVPLPDGHRGGDVAGGPPLLHLLGQHLGQVLAALLLGAPPHAGGEVLFQVKGDLVQGELRGGHLVLVHHVDELGVGDLPGAGVGDLGGQEVKKDHQNQGPENGPDEKPPPPGAAALSLVVVVGIQRYGSLHSGGTRPLCGCLWLRRGCPRRRGCLAPGKSPVGCHHGTIFPHAMQGTPCDFGVKKL